jgi:hypothetical protein
VKERGVSPKVPTLSVYRELWERKPEVQRRGRYSGKIECKCISRDQTASHVKLWLYLTGQALGPGLGTL